MSNKEIATDITLHPLIGVQQKKMEKAKVRHVAFHCSGTLINAVGILSYSFSGVQKMLSKRERPATTCCWLVSAIKRERVRKGCEERERKRLGLSVARATRENRDSICVHKGMVPWAGSGLSGFNPGRLSKFSQDPHRTYSADFHSTRSGCSIAYKHRQNYNVTNYKYISYHD